METALKKDIYEHLAPVWEDTSVTEVQSEYVVPDAMPDIGSVVNAESILTVKSKETEVGSVRLSASVSVLVVYTPEMGGAMRSVEVTLPADIRMDAPPVDTDCRTVARLRVRSVDARTINSRKLSVRAEIEAEARSYRKESMELASGLEEPDGSTHLLCRSAEAMLVADVREKNFVVMDDYALPAEMSGVEAILSRRAETILESVSYVSGKVVFRGRVCAELILSAPDSDRAYTAQYETEFSQIMEVDTEAAEALPEVTLFMTGVYFDLPERGAEANRIAAELHFAAQTVCRQTVTLPYIADIYSNRRVLVPEMTDLALIREERPVSLRQTVTGTSEPSAEGGELLAATASVGAVTVDGTSVKASVTLRSIIRTEGGYLPARCRLTAEFGSVELPENGTLRDISVTVTDIFRSGAELRATCRLDAKMMICERVACVTSVTEDTQTVRDTAKMPSVTLIRAGQDADLWMLARKYASTPEAIEAANEGRGEGLLLIPKCR